MNKDETVHLLEAAAHLLAGAAHLVAIGQPAVDTIEHARSLVAMAHDLSASGVIK